MNKALKIVFTGLLAGFVSEGVLGALFMSSMVQSILYNPNIQSQLFIEVTPQRNMAVSIIGVIVLSILHAWLYTIYVQSIPGKTWIKKGLFWGLTIWLMFWVFQEWFIYHTLLAEPLILNALELVILLIGSFVEGLIIAFAFREEFSAPDKLAYQPSAFQEAHHDRS